MMKLTVLAAFIGSGVAIPVASPDGSVKLAKRAEGVHLVNCGERYSVVLVSSAFPSSSPNHIQSNQQSSTAPTMEIAISIPAQAINACQRTVVCSIGKEELKNALSQELGQHSLGVFEVMRSSSRITRRLGKCLLILIPSFRNLRNFD